MTDYPFWFSWAAASFGFLVHASSILWPYPLWLQVIVFTAGVGVLSLVMKTRINRHVSELMRS